MPEIGFDDEPISPVSREETVTNRNPKMMIRIAAAMRAAMPVPPTYSGFAEGDDHDEGDDAEEHDLHREIAIGARHGRGIDRSAAFAVSRVGEAALDAVPDHRQRAEDADDSARGDGACADVEDVCVADRARAHVPDQRRRLRSERLGQRRRRSNLIIGMSTRYASTPPAHMIAAMRGPMM